MNKRQIVPNQKLSKEECRNSEEERQIMKNVRSLERLFHSLNKKYPSRDWSLQESIKKRNNKHDIFDAISYHEKMTSRQLWKWLNKVKKEKNGTLKVKSKQSVCLRTIQRYLKEDPRIVKEGWYYRVNEKARFEPKYINPEKFARQIFLAFIGKEEVVSSGTNLMRKFILDAGALLVFTFIEALRPFEDESMSIRERNQLVKYWVNNAFPVDILFERFQELFTNTGKVNPNRARNELDENSLKNILKLFENSGLDACRELLYARSQFTQYTKMVNGKLAYIHGKTYHADYEGFKKYRLRSAPVVIKQKWTKKYRKK